MTLHRGKIARNPEVLEVRPLTRDDLAILTEPRGPAPDRAGSGHVARLRDPHHRLARLVAAGLRDEEVCVRGGYSLSRLATLKKDPTFIELVERYREKVTEAFVDAQEAFIELATANMVIAERMLAEKLEEHDEQGTTPSIRELMSIRSDSADRLGIGKKNTNLNVNMDFAAKMEETILRTRRVRELAPSSVSPQQTPTAQAGEGRTAPAVLDLPPNQFRRRA